MTAALRQDIPDRRSARRTAYRTSTLPNLRPPEPRRPESANAFDLKPQVRPTPRVTPLPQPRPVPAWLKLLMKVQQGSTVMTLVLMGAVLAIYGWTVFTQQRWGQEYRRWGALQKQEQQLMATNEVLKNQMAQQAETPKTGLVAPSPSSMIFLAPAAPRPAVQPDIEASTPDLLPNKPLGY
ncbi:MAG: hypothetical protein KME11_09970 [Timaviella obliquedivisa GSE-PSE-MK23-08B]|nr:hypothetical protein [Timaviella obliquedivisa GSE-PSE-MK23-08B]